jgi:hypothetical protein
MGPRRRRGVPGLLASLGVLGVLGLAAAGGGCGAGKDRAPEGRGEDAPVGGPDAAGARPSFAQIAADPCPTLDGVFRGCGITLTTTYVDECRRSFTGTSPDDLAARCTEECLYGAPADSCAAIVSREQSRLCASCCAPVARGKPSTCPSTAAGDGGAPVDASPDVVIELPDAVGDIPACVQRNCGAQIVGCATTAACPALVECLLACTTDVCRFDCATRSNPAAVSAVSALAECSKQYCAAAPVGPNPPGG